MKADSDSKSLDGKRPALTLVHAQPRPVCRQTIAAFEQLLEGARSGQIVGAAFAVQLPNSRFFVDTCGLCSRDPTYARGIVRSLDDELGRMVQERADTDTTIDPSNL